MYRSTTTILTDRMVSPDDGPASRRLSRARPKLELLPLRSGSFSVGLKIYFSEPRPPNADRSSRAHRSPLLQWSSNRRILRGAGVEDGPDFMQALLPAVSRTASQDHYTGPFFRPLPRRGGQGGREHKQQVDRSDKTE